MAQQNLNFLVVALIGHELSCFAELSTVLRLSRHDVRLLGPCYLMQYLLHLAHINP